MLWAGLAMFAGVFAVGVALDDTEAELLLLFAVPIYALAIRFGFGSGIAAAGLALALLVLWAQLREIALPFHAYVTRAAVFSLVALLGNLAREDHAGGRARGDLDGRVNGDVEGNGMPRPVDSNGEGPKGTALHSLSAREVEVLRFLALGYTNNEIAHELYLSPRTIESHRAHINQKLRCSTRAELVQHALESDLIGSGRSS